MMKLSELGGSFTGGNSKWWKAKDGANKVRIVSDVFPFWKAFDRENKSSRQYVTENGAKADKEAKRRFAVYILNRDEGSALQVAEFGPTVMKQIYDLSINPDYKFEGLPPYDHTITRTGAGMDTEYSVVAARSNTELTAEEQALVAAAEPLYKGFVENAEDGDMFVPF